MYKIQQRSFMSSKLFFQVLFSISIIGGLMNNVNAAKGKLSSWMSKDRIMVIYNTTHMDSIEKGEAKTFSKDMGAWYMKQYGMPTKHLFGYDMGKKVYWDKPGAFDFLKAVADYIKANKIQVVLMAPGTPLIIRDKNKLHNLCLDSLAGHALWFAHVKKEAPTCTKKRSVAPEDSNLYFPYMDMKDGASPFVIRTKDAKRWVPSGKDLVIRERQWYDTMMKDLRDHPSVRPYGRIGMPYYLEAMGTNRRQRPKKGAPKDKNGKPIRELWSAEKLKIMDIPKENSKFVKDLVLGGFASRTSIEEFNKQTKRCLLFFGREGNTASFIDVESSISEAMAQDAIMEGVDAARIVRIKSRRGLAKSCPLKEPKWDYTYKQFMSGSIKPGINPLIFSAGGVNNTTEIQTPWPKSLDVQPGQVAAVSVSNGKAFAGSLLKRGATTMIVNLHHPQNSRLHGWFTVFRQLMQGATVAESMITSGGSERGGYITGSIWGDPLYAPFGNNKKKTYWITGGK
jgi:hypothetical protein